LQCITGLPEATPIEAATLLVLSLRVESLFVVPSSSLLCLLPEERGDEFPHGSDQGQRPR
jgi:hypothetical protein